MKKLLEMGIDTNTFRWYPDEHEEAPGMRYRGPHSLLQAAMAVKRSECYDTLRQQVKARGQVEWALASKWSWPADDLYEQHELRSFFATKKAINMAARSGNLVNVKRCLEAGAKAYWYEPWHDERPLDNALQAGAVEVAAYLIEHGAEAQLQDPADWLWAMGDIRDFAPLTAQGDLARLLLKHTIGARVLMTSGPGLLDYIKPAIWSGKKPPRLELVTAILEEMVHWNVISLRTEVATACLRKYKLPLDSDAENLLKSFGADKSSVVLWEKDPFYQPEKKDASYQSQT